MLSAEISHDPNPARNGNTCPRPLGTRDAALRPAPNDRHRITSQYSVILPGLAESGAVSCHHWYAAAVTNVLTTDRKHCNTARLQRRLKRIVDLVAERGITCNADSIFISTGAQRMLDVFTRLFVNPGDLVILRKYLHRNAAGIVAVSATHRHGSN